VDELCRALADPSRRRLLDSLSQRTGQTLRELCAGQDLTRQAVSKHLAVLQAANLVTTVRRGREKLHCLNAAPISDIVGRWVDRYGAARVALSDLKVALDRGGASVIPGSIEKETLIAAPAETVYRWSSSPLRSPSAPVVQRRRRARPGPGGQGRLTSQHRATSQQMAVRLRAQAAEPPYLFSLRGDYPDRAQPHEGNAPLAEFHPGRGRSTPGRQRRAPTGRPTRQCPGMSAFVLEDGVVYHTYSGYERGLDGLWGIYQWLGRRRAKRGAAPTTRSTGTAARTSTTAQTGEQMTGAGPARRCTTAQITQFGRDLGRHSDDRTTVQNGGSERGYQERIALSGSLAYAARRRGGTRPGGGTS
jgi:DNA-binding transcriptional ArsR family regulator